MEEVEEEENKELFLNKDIRSLKKVLMKEK